MAISEFSLFDEIPRVTQEESLILSKQKKFEDNILSKNFKKADKLSLNKKNINSYSTTNDKTLQKTPKQKNEDNVNEVSSFSLCEKSKESNKILNFTPDEEQMEIEDMDENNSSILLESPNSQTSKKKSIKEKNLNSSNTKSGDDAEEEVEFKYIRKQSTNNFSLKFPKFDEDYVIIKTLCNGEMGTVYLCMKFQDKKTYVVKMTDFFSRKFDYFNMKNFLECLISKEDMPGAKFLQKYIDFWIEDIQVENSKIGNKKMYIVTEYCLGGDLREFLNKIKKTKKYDKDYFWDIVFQMIASVSFLHKLGYIHFDIKPSNFLVQENGQLVLSDFCLTIKEKDIVNYSSEDFEGDSIFISPELFYKDKDTITSKTDIFSLGLSILQILTNIELPKNGLTWQLIRTAGVPKEFFEQIPYFDGDNQIFKNLILAMTSYKSQNRPDLESILNDKENYPYLYERYQLLLNNKYVTKINLNSLENFRRDSYDFSSSIGDFKKRFAKRSDSMKIADYFKAKENK